MYKLIAFNEVAENFSAHFALGISRISTAAKAMKRGCCTSSRTNLCGTYTRIADMNAPNFWRISCAGDIARRLGNFSKN
ncbi:hypothetical protein [Bacteroides sp.]|jgi:hypothetical protein|uniref:hypothetical protein n=1 Tax=Bacteroides sp. TaxID=29523 RepID=UPI00258967B9|nr:hypothetical protein [Bacteroides sp.]